MFALHVHFTCVGLNGQRKTQTTPSGIMPLKISAQFGKLQPSPKDVKVVKSYGVKCLGSMSGPVQNVMKLSFRERANAH